MFYMIWMTGDFDTFDWFEIRATKQQAMRRARELAKEQGKTVKFFYDDDVSLMGDVADATTEILVWATDNYYHGA